LALLFVLGGGAYLLLERYGGEAPLKVSMAPREVPPEAELTQTPEVPLQEEVAHAPLLRRRSRGPRPPLGLPPSPSPL